MKATQTSQKTLVDRHRTLESANTIIQSMLARLEKQKLKALQTLIVKCQDSKSESKRYTFYVEYHQSLDEISCREFAYLEGVGQELIKEL